MLHVARPAARGFTLVELLVVIGIIALLISILLPSLARARQSAVNIQCQANLRTIGQGLAIYASENRGMFPYGWSTSIPDPAHPGTNMTLQWPQTVANLLTGAGLNPRHHESHVGVNSLVCPARVFEPAFAWTPRHTYAGHPIVFLQNFYNGPLWGTGAGSFRFAISQANAPLYKVVWLKNPSEKVIAWDAAQRFASEGQVVPVSAHIDGDRFYSRTKLVENQGLWPTWLGLNTLDEPADVTYGHLDYGPENGNRDYYRFRHMNNNVGNFLFGDGHVESFTKSGNTSGLLRRNVCVNYPWPGANPL